MTQYLIYKTTNQINGKIYVGKHKCNHLRCSYLGSGKHLRNAITKYGKENFTREILRVCQTEQEMNEFEREIVTEEFYSRDDTYNACLGGQDGNINGVLIQDQRLNDPTLAKRAAYLGGKRMKELMSTDIDFKRSHLEKCGSHLRPDAFKGRKHTSETKQKMSEKTKLTSAGSKNSQFGTMWITNGTENRKIKKDLDTIPEGWYKGRR